MRYTIKNDRLQVTVDTLGAQLMSVRSAEGCEYLWQGDPAYWADRAPVLFPIIGRLEGKQYQLEGKCYPMTIHGFAAGAEFACTQCRDRLVLALESTPQTKACYPCDFRLEITYRLEENTLLVEQRVENRGADTMHFGLGGHPGFRVPLEAGEAFADYYLEFDREACPVRVGFTDDTVLLNGADVPYALETGKRLPLSHELFDRDAIILRDMAKTVTLCSRVSGPRVRVCYPDMDYLGIWHRPRKAAPYVCIEPWTSLPGRSGVLEDIALRQDFVHLEAGKTYENTWTVTLQ